VLVAEGEVVVGAVTVRVEDPGSADVEVKVTTLATVAVVVVCSLNNFFLLLASLAIVVVCPLNNLFVVKPTVDVDDLYRNYTGSICDVSATV
jgi:hypothetical protein